MSRLGYFRLGAEAVAFWQSDSGERKIDVNPKTGRRYVLGWRSDYGARRGKPVVMVDSDDGEDMARLSADPGLTPVTAASWAEFQQKGQWA